MSLIPRWVWLVGLALAVTAYTAMIYNQGKKAERAVWIERELERQQIALKVEQEARAEENRKRVNNERIQSESIQRENKLRTIIADNRSELDRLRDTIAGYSQPTADSETQRDYASEAETARSLLAICAREYSSVAEDAAKLSTQVIDWQNYYQEVIK